MFKRHPVLGLNHVGHTLFVTLGGTLVVRTPQVRWDFMNLDLNQSRFSEILWLHSSTTGVAGCTTTCHQQPSPIVGPIIALAPAGLMWRLSTSSGYWEVGQQCQPGRHGTCHVVLFKSWISVHHEKKNSRTVVQHCGILGITVLVGFEQRLFFWKCHSNLGGWIHPENTRVKTNWMIEKKHKAHSLYGSNPKKKSRTIKYHCNSDNLFWGVAQSPKFFHVFSIINSNGPFKSQSSGGSPRRFSPTPGHPSSSLPLHRYAAAVPPVFQRRCAAAANRGIARGSPTELGPFHVAQQRGFHRRRQGLEGFVALVNLGHDFCLIHCRWIFPFKTIQP